MGDTPGIPTTVTYSIDKQFIDTNAKNERSADILIQKGLLSSTIVAYIYTNKTYIHTNTHTCTQTNKSS